MTKSFFSHIVAAPADPILELTQLFQADPRSEKVNLSVGLYHDEKLRTPVMRAVKKAEDILLKQEQTKAYLPIQGDKNFIHHLGALVFGEFFWMHEKERVAAVQAPGGTGSLRIGGEFLKQEVGDRIAISDPSWPNHKNIFTRCGMKVEAYPYYDFQNHGLAWERTLAFFRSLAPGSIVLFHACCHNPTGLDFNQEQWKMISDLFLKNRVIVFFDFAYQGFGAGLEEDAGVIRLFANAGHEMVVSASQSKNFGMYGERVGGLFVLVEGQGTALNVLSKLKAVVRANYSNPPMHGAKAVAEILSTPSLRKLWEEELFEYRSRISQLRTAFVKGLGHEFRFLEERSGLFSFTGLSKSHVEKLREEFAIYMVGDGRINIAGLNHDNVNYVIDAIGKVIR